MQFAWEFYLKIPFLPTLNKAEADMNASLFCLKIVFPENIFQNIYFFGKYMCIIIDKG